MDGIGGIVIGNVFKVQKDRLPKGYQGDEIAFVVMTENQKITSGQDWTTDITGQLILLDIPKEKIELIIEESTPEETPQSENAEALDDVGMEWAMSHLSITPTGIVGRGADKSFEIRIKNPTDSTINWNTTFPDNITGGLTSGVGTEYVFNVSNAYMDLDMLGGQSVESLDLETTLINHIEFTENQIILSTEYIAPTIVPGEDPPPPPPTPPTPKKIYINLNEFSTGIVDEDGNQFHLYPEAEEATTSSTSSSTPPSNEQLVENYKGYDIYKIGTYYELKKDVVPGGDWEAYTTAGDGFSYITDLRSAIDSDLDGT